MSNNIKNFLPKINVKYKDGFIYSSVDCYIPLKTKCKQQNFGVLFLFGLFIGFVNGFFGGGGGMICVPILSSLICLPSKVSHATAILVMLPLSISSFIVYAFKNTIDINNFIVIGIAFSVGGLLGAFLLKKINNVLLGLIFSLIIIVAGLRLLF